MKLFRVTNKIEAEKVIASKRMLPNNETHESCFNDFVAHGRRAFWFFTSMEDAIEEFGSVASYHETQSYDRDGGIYDCNVIIEYEIPEDFVTLGHGYYLGLCVNEAITREIRGAWLVDIHHIDEPSDR